MTIEPNRTQLHVQLPTLKELKLALEQSRAEHDRLLPEAWAPGAWRTGLQHPEGAAMLDFVRTRAGHSRQKPLEPLLYSEFVLFGKTGDRIIYDDKYFDRRKRLSDYAVLLLTEGGDEWKPLLEDVIWAICDEYTWCIPAHVGLYRNAYPNDIWDRPAPPRDTVDLFAGETAFALVEIVALLEDVLSPWVVHRARENVRRRALDSFFHDPAPHNWELKTNNWPAVCASSIGAAALYLERDAERLSGMLWRVLQALRGHLSGFDDDGATPEGVGYWQYGFGYFVAFAELLRNRTDGRIDLLESEEVRRIAAFPHSCILSNGRVVNFSDSPDTVSFSLGLYCRLQDRYPGLPIPQQPPGQPSGISQRSWVYGVRDMLWTARAHADDGERGRRREAAQQGQDQLHPPTLVTKRFTGNQWVVSKRSGADGLTAFAAKGGHNGEPHNHIDLGHFILHVRGENVLMDLGQGLYTKQYFNELRYTHLHTGSQGHSVPIIDGCLQKVGVAYSATMQDYAERENGVIFSLDLTNAYDCAKLSRFVRRFDWGVTDDDTGCRLVVTDEFAFNDLPETLTETFVCSCEPKPDAPGLLRVGSVAIRFSDEAYRPEIANDLVTDANGSPLEVWRILLHARKPEAVMSSRVEFEIAE